MNELDRMWKETVVIRFCGILSKLGDSGRNSVRIDGKKFRANIPMPVGVRAKAWVCDRLLAGIAGSNPTEVMEICLL